MSRASRVQQSAKDALVTTFDNLSQVRYRLALELWNRMDQQKNLQVVAIRPSCS